MSFKGTAKAQSAKDWKLEVMAKLETKYNCQLDPSQCVLVDTNTNLVIAEDAQLKGVDLIQLTLQKMAEADEKEDTGPGSDDEAGKRNIASRLRKSMLAKSKSKLFRPADAAEIEHSNSKRFESDLERYNRLKSGHAKVLESVTRYVETAAAHAEAGIKLQEDLKLYFKRSSRSECNEEFVPFHELQMNILERQRKIIHDSFQPMVDSLQMLKQLDGFKQQVSQCTDTLAEINKQNRALAISKPQFDAAMKSPGHDIEAKSVAHAKITQEIATLYAQLEKHELAFERAMDSFDATTSFVLLRHMGTLLSTAISDSKFTLAKIGEMETHLETEFPATISQFEDEFEKTQQRREKEESILKTAANFQGDLLEEKQYLQPSDPPLLQAEKILNTAANVMNLGQRGLCVLVLTNYRLVAVPYTHTRSRKRDPRTIDIPLMSIVRSESTESLLSIWLGDLRHFVFGFSLKTEISKLTNVLRYFCFQVPKSFAFTLRNFSSPEEEGGKKLVDVGWSVYSPELEFSRQGVLRQVNGVVSSTPQWRLSQMNKNFAVCSTYPEFVILPTELTDAEAKESADHRTRNRLPVLTWKHPSSKVALFRGSQPKMGVTRSRKKADERLLALLGSIAHNSEEKDEGSANSSGNSAATAKKGDGYPDCTLASIKSFVTPATSMVIFDARPYKNAVANVAKGGGWELPDNYPNSVCVFCDIENIHEVRGALQTLRTSFESLSQRPAEPIAMLDSHEHYDLAHIQTFVRELDQSHRKLENEAIYQPLVKSKSRWYKHVSLLLRAASVMTDTMNELQLSVLSHCSDGWDRTAQLAALTSLMQDPYYRTIKGFAVLIEKDWVSFGHKFSERMGLGAPPDKLAAKRSNFNDSQRAPIFLQWIDSVFQILRQHPHSFEFNALFLADLVDHVHSCRFGTFLGNCAQDRTEAALRQKTVSLWSFVLSTRIRPYYENPDFLPSFAPLRLKSEVDDMVLFLPFFQRWDPSLPPAFSLVAADGSFEFHSLSPDESLQEHKQQEVRATSKSEDNYHPFHRGKRPANLSISSSDISTFDDAPPASPTRSSRVSSPSPPPLHKSQSPARPPPPVPTRVVVRTPSDRPTGPAPPRPKQQVRSSSLVGVPSAGRRPPPPSG